jgi:hypothetical protein
MSQVTHLSGAKLVEAIDRCIVIEATAPPVKYSSEADIALWNQDKQDIARAIEQLPATMDGAAFEAEITTILSTCKSSDARNANPHITMNHVVSYTS